jgi:transposase
VPEGERTCAGCGAGFEPLGYDDSEQVDWRVVITRIVHRRRRYRRVCSCAGARTVVAPAPAKPIAKGRFTAGFLARLVFEKYVLGRPLHRIAMALAADGLDVAQGTLSGALKQVADLFAPLVARITARNAAAAHVHADETSWRVFERVEDTDGTRWWLWVFAAPRGAASYRLRSRQRWEELSLDLMADLEPKGVKGKQHARKPVTMPRRMGWCTGRSA